MSLLFLDLVLEVGKLFPVTIFLSLNFSDTVDDLPRLSPRRLFKLCFELLKFLIDFFLNCCIVSLCMFFNKLLLLLFESLNFSIYFHLLFIEH